MKTLVVYYSRTGTSQRLAQIIANRLHADLEKIVDTVDRSGAKGYLLAGRDAMQKRPAKIAQTTYLPQAYDLVILVSPVWAWSLTPAMRSYVLANRSNFNKIGLVLTRGGSDVVKVFKELEELCGKKATSKLTLLTKEVIQESGSDLISEFIGDFKV
ncbi:MAG: hypothetical protein WCG01_01235 [bacterium]